VLFVLSAKRGGRLAHLHSSSTWNLGPANRAQREGGGRDEHKREARRLPEGHALGSELEAHTLHRVIPLACARTMS
jgi:hypothetical protein